MAGGGGSYVAPQRIRLKMILATILVVITNTYQTPVTLKRIRYENILETKSDGIEFVNKPFVETPVQAENKDNDSHKQSNGLLINSVMITSEKPFPTDTPTTPSSTIQTTFLGLGKSLDHKTEQGINV